MYRSVKASSDTYITDRIIRGVRQEDACVGEAGTLDLFKIYGLNKTGSTELNELSRLLVQFDLTALRTDYQAGLFDINSSTFKCHIRLHDVYGGQTTPREFTVKAYPLSRSWSEGRGRDVVFYQDSDVANFLTATYSASGASTWFMSGANASGLLGSSDIDIISSGNLGAGVTNLFATQSFVDGTEDLNLDVTRVISATLAGLIPDHGFRISFTETQESDNRTRFVKRFGSRQAIDANLRPEMIVRYDNSRVSHQSSFVFNASGTIFLNNYVRGTPSNVVSGSTLTSITGSNCMLLKVWTLLSGSEYAQYVTASQHTVGSQNSTGIYSATFAINSSNSSLTSLIRSAASSGSNGKVKFNETWTSLDGSVAYHSTSLYVSLPDSTVGSFRPKKYDINIPNVATDYNSDDVVRLRTFVFDRTNPFHRFVRVPQEEPSVIIETHYSVRDVLSDAVIIPFDRIYNSTRMSSDGNYLYFDVWMESLIEDRTYVVDVMIVDGGEQEIFYNASPRFRVVPT